MALLVSRVSLQHCFSWLRSKVSTIQAGALHLVQAKHPYYYAMVTMTSFIKASNSDVILKTINLQEQEKKSKTSVYTVLVIK